MKNVADDIESLISSSTSKLVQDITKSIQEFESTIHKEINIEIVRIQVESEEQKKKFEEDFRQRQDDLEKIKKEEEEFLSRLATKFKEGEDKRTDFALLQKEFEQKQREFEEQKKKFEEQKNKLEEDFRQRQDDLEKRRSDLEKRQAELDEKQRKLDEKQKGLDEKDKKTDIEKKEREAEDKLKQRELDEKQRKLDEKQKQKGLDEKDKKTDIEKNERKNTIDNELKFERMISVLCYIIIIVGPILSLIIWRNNKFIVSHATKSIVMVICVAISWFFFTKSNSPILSYGILVVGVIFWIVMIIGAYQGKK